MRKFFAVGAITLGLTWSTFAGANPRPLPFTYTTQTTAEGEAEIEQYADLSPVQARRAAELPADRKKVTILASQFQTEFEYGITDRLELGLYFVLAPVPGEAYVEAPRLTQGNGLKQRLRYRLADEGAWPIDVALYGEVAEFTDEIEFEGKIILMRRFGDLRIATNLWAEYEAALTKGEGEVVLNPTLGATYQVTPTFHPGIEGWMRYEFVDEDEEPGGKRPFDAGPHVYVGPTTLLSFGPVWWSTGVYLRATDMGHSQPAGEGFGPLWFRTIVGIGI
jgi:hypothetical protein